MLSLCALQTSQLCLRLHLAAKIDRETVFGIFRCIGSIMSKLMCVIFLSNIWTRGQKSVKSLITS